ncbi:MAG: ankyrin repeat domain-containing protein [Planctomycetes bacterium]|nr:ankyrin repeat domain-containing protein [Planctomycetota bacterium]
MNKSMVVGSTCVLLGAIVLGAILWVNQSLEDSPDASQGIHVPPPDPAPATSTPANELALREAALEGLIQEVNRLLNLGTQASAADEENRTALMLAAFNGHTSSAQALIDKGAAIDTRDETGRTALIYASSGPNAEVVELLLKHKANPNVVDKVEEWSALMFAAAEGQAKVVSLLLQHGADVTLKDIDGESAHDFSLSKGHSDVAKLLAEAEKQ